MEAEDHWLPPHIAVKLGADAFGGSEAAARSSCMADCTNGIRVQCSGQDENINTQLYSSYYKMSCVKICVCCSKVRPFLLRMRVFVSTSYSSLCVCVASRSAAASPSLLALVGPPPTIVAWKLVACLKRKSGKCLMVLLKRS